VSVVVPVPPRVRDRTIASIAWTLAIGNWIFPIAIVVGPVFFVFCWIQRRTGRVPVHAIECAVLGFVGNLLLVYTLTR
jgi:hypothetical protein